MRVPPSRVLSRVYAAGTVLLATVGLCVIPSGASPLRVPPAPNLSYGVGVSRCTFVDHSRGVVDVQTSPLSWLTSSRTLVTEIRYPVIPRGPSTESAGAIPERRPGGYPTIVFAHGYDATPDTYAPLLDAWVRAGFVVAAPFFPAESPVGIARQHQVNTEDDLWNEPADLAFVARQLLRASRGYSSSCHVARGLVRPSELALAGHSDGATAVGMLAYAHGNDPQGASYERLRRGLHFRAAMILSGKEDGVDPYGPPFANPSLLVVQSVADQCNPARNALRLYAAIDQADKWLLELRSGHHLPPFDGRDRRAFPVVSAATIRFLRLTLEGKGTAATLVAAGERQPAVARMVQADATPPIPAVATAARQCGLN